MRHTEKYVNLLLIVIAVLCVYMFCLMAGAGSNINTTVRAENEQVMTEYPMTSAVKSSLEQPEQEVSDVLTEKAVTEMYQNNNDCFEQRSDFEKVERFKKSNYKLLTNSIKVYKANSSEYTQFTFVLKKNDDYVVVSGNYYNKTKKIILIISQDVYFKVDYNGKEAEK